MNTQKVKQSLIFIFYLLTISGEDEDHHFRQRGGGGGRGREEKWICGRSGDRQPHQLRSSDDLWRSEYYWTAVRETPLFFTLIFNVKLRELLWVLADCCAVKPIVSHFTTWVIHDTNYLWLKQDSGYRGIGFRIFFWNKLFLNCILASSRSHNNDTCQKAQVN